MRRFLYVFFLLGISALALGQKVSAQTETPLKFSEKSVHELRLTSQNKGEYQIETTGSDPYLFTEPLTSALLEKNHILSFEYFCPTWLDHLQIFFAPPIKEDRSLHTELGVSEGWTTFSIDVKDELKNWGKDGSFLRLDFGSAPNYRMQIRNIRFREPTPQEMQKAANRDKEKAADAILDKELNAYLKKNYANSIKDITVNDSSIIIKGNLNSLSGGLQLAEVPLYQDITQLKSFDRILNIPTTKKDFQISTRRFIKVNGKTYDRLFSKWVIVKKNAEAYELLSHARYPDHIKPLYDLPDEKPRGKKGIGGFSAGGKAPVSDLDELGITSVTINIWITKFMRSKPSESTIPFEYQGKTYYVDQKSLASLDKTLQLSTQKNIISSAIILIDKAVNCPDKEIGRIFEHPDCDPAGIYSMANVTSAEGLEYYAAIIDFLAQRYSRPDKKYGRLHHWIMHNEVDAGWVWTNMGEKTPLLFMDDYHKSMRTVYNIARKYNAHSKVFISLTHYWAWTSDRHYYHSDELLDILLDFSKAEGDFEWAIAQHPYPESLFEPKSWLDKKVDFTFKTPLITYKNIEVLDAWVRQPRTMYLGKHVRTIHLSEQGTNSMDYSDKSLQEQAAGMAYAWKKIKNLKNIEAFQYHNWMDNRGEGGLRIGLRRFPDDKDDPGGVKPVWHVFKNAGTENEDKAFEFAKDIIGIKTWDQVMYKGEIDSIKRVKNYRDLKSDTWVATDALGRKLPLYTETGPPKKNKQVGIFYFLTFDDPGKNGPSDVSKIKSANPLDPKWESGTHYWGEPESGYYLSADEAVIRQHAHMLADAGVDVIIFDCTNNNTYPQITETIFKVFRKIREEGEKTPDIAFLASEKSVLQVWDQIYSKGLYADLWFQWKGKPLLLFGQWEGIKPMNSVEFPSHIQNFFSIRNSWAWTTLPWYKNEGKDMWPWVDHFPQQAGWHESKDKPEYIPVAVAQHPLSNIGRSFHKGKQPATDQYDLTPQTGEGLHFAEQWERALSLDPEFVFVTGWNEWTAGKQTMKDDIQNELKKWDFYPGAKLGKVGKELKTGDVYFIDQYNQEYSRDIEPMKGGHSDNYYYQLLANVRKYKGTNPSEKAKSSKPIDIRGKFSQWDKAGINFYDHVHDTEKRNALGNFLAGPYTNFTGRNDISTIKVSHDLKNIYFYVQTREKLSSEKDRNWMLLFIDADQNTATGWEGYDFVVNKDVTDATHTTISRLDNNGNSGQKISLPLKIEGKQMMFSIPASLLTKKKNLAFDFHLADNIQKLGDLNEFLINGDQAPSRRANYRYQE